MEQQDLTLSTMMPADTARAKYVNAWIDGSINMTELLFPEDDIYCHEAVGEIIHQLITTQEGHAAHLGALRVILFDYEKVIDFDIVSPDMAGALFDGVKWPEGDPNIMPAYRRINDEFDMDFSNLQQNDQPNSVNILFLAGCPQDNAEFVEQLQQVPPNYKYIICLFGPSYRGIGDMSIPYHVLAVRNPKSIQVVNANVLSIAEARAAIISLVA